MCNTSSENHIVWLFEHVVQYVASTKETLISPSGVKNFLFILTGNDFRKEEPWRRVQALLLYSIMSKQYMDEGTPSQSNTTYVSRLLLVDFAVYKSTILFYSTPSFWIAAPV